MNSANIKYLIKLLVTTTVILFVTDKIVYKAITLVSDKVYTGQSIGKINQFLNLKDGMDLLIFGSSRANHNVDPKKLTDNGYNMGLDGRRIAFCAALIKTLPKAKKQTVLLHIEARNVFSKTYVGDDLTWLQSKYNSNKIIKNEIEKLGLKNPFQDFFWCLSYNGKVLGTLKNFVRPNYNHTKYDGYDPIQPTARQQEIFKTKEENRVYGDCDKSFILNSIYDQYLDVIALFCKQENKDLILFSAPMYNDHCLEDNAKLKNLLEAKGIKYYDFTNFFKEENSYSYWKDATHLSKEGAEIFSDSLRTVLD